MELGSLQQFQLEARQHAESLSTHLTEAAAHVQAGRTDEALDLYRAGQRDLQAFHDKWDADIQRGDPSFAHWWRQHVAEKKAALLMAEGLALRWIGKLDDASAVFERALGLTPAETPEHALLLHGIGGIRHHQQAFAEAEEFCRRAHAEFAALAANVAKTDPNSAGHSWSQAAQALADSAYAALGRGDHTGFEKSLDEAISFAEQHGLLDLADRLWLRQAGYLLAVDASGETVQRVDSEREFCGGDIPPLLQTCLQSKCKPL